MLSDSQIDRYSRQILLPGFGGMGQERLLAARVAVVGSGPIAGIATTYLAAAGIGAIDVYTDASESAATPASSAFHTNPDCRITRRSQIGSVPADLALCEWVAGVLDSTRLAPLRANGRTRFVIGRAHAGTATLVHVGTGCFRCALREFPPANEAAPANAALQAATEAFAGALLAHEAIGLLTGSIAPDIVRRTDLDLRCGEVMSAGIAPWSNCTHNVPGAPAPAPR